MIKKIKKSIFFKILGFYLLIIFLLGVSIYLLSLNPIRSYYIEVLSGNLAKIGATLKPEIIPLVENRRFNRLDALVKELDKDIDTRITVIDNEGAVLADSENDPKLMENHNNRYEVGKALEGEITSSLRFSRTLNREMLYLAMPVSKDDRNIAVLRLSMFTSHIDTLIDRLKLKILQIIIIMAAVSLLFALIFTRNLSVPIRQLVDCVHRIAAGDFDTRIYLNREDEIRELADSFNHMAGEIKSLFGELSLRKEELDNIIYSIRGGFLVLDREGRIVLCNDDFKKIANTGPLNNKFYWEAVREPGFNGFIRELLEGEGNITRELEINGRYYLGSAAKTSPGSELIIILQDVTDIKNIENIKKDFVANVSHELKTPLTAIKGFVENLEDAPPKYRHQLEIINRNIDRLINIVRDLLTLSKLEEKGIKPEYREVNFAETVKDVLKIFEKPIKEKGLSLDLELPAKLSPVFGDPFRLEQLLINLLDNAVKYTEKGGIKLALKQLESALLMEISDTGIGIPEEHLSRIFERFYVVDKSRSRKSGGTGLGLAIAKHIVLLHNGTINLESTVNKGTKFTVTLPVKKS